MKKLYLLILRSYAGPAIATFFIVVFVLMMQFLWRYVDELVGKGLEWQVIVQLMFYASFTFVPTALPISILLSSLMTFGNLGEHYELVAIKAAGVSLRKILFPIGLLTLLLSVGAYYYANIVYPYANFKFRTTLYDVRQKKLSLNIREGIFYTGLQGYTIKIGKKAPNGVSINNVMIYDHTQMQGANKLILADSGTMLQTQDGNFLLLTLFNGTNIDESSARGYSENVTFRRTKFLSQVVKFDLSQFKMTKTDGDFFRSAYFMLNYQQLTHVSDSLGNEIASREKESYNSILNYMRNFADAKLNDSLFYAYKNDSSVLYQFDSESNIRKQLIAENALNMVRNTKGSFDFNKQMLKDKTELKARHDIERHRKFTLSFACFVLFLIGAPLGAIIRKGGLGMPLVISVLLFVTYHVISFTGEKAVRSSVIDPWQGMWMSTMIFLPVGIFLVYQATTDSKLLDAEIYKRITGRLTNFFKK